MRNERGPQPLARLALNAIQIIPFVVYITQLYRLKHWLIDDALISLAYARSIASGVYAQTATDAPVEGVSNPLWTLMLVALRWLGVTDAGNQWLGIDDYVLTFRVIAAICFLGIQAILLVTLRRIDPQWGPLLAMIAAMSLALSPSFVIWTASGLENPLYALLVASLTGLSAWASARPSSVTPLIGAAFAVLAFFAAATRPDGLAFSLVFPAVALALHHGIGRRRLVGSLATYALMYSTLLGAGLVWRYQSFGLLVPNTALAKAQRFGLESAFGRLGELPTALTWPITLLIVLLAVGAAIWGKNRLELFAAAWPAAISAGVFMLLTRDWMGEYRFATPIIVSSAFLLGVSSLQLLKASAPIQGRGSLRYPGLVVALVSSVALSGLAQVGIDRLSRFASSPTVPGCFVADRYGRLFNWYADTLHLGSQSTLLLPDLGGVLLTSRLRIVDFAGLTEPTIARLRNSGDLEAINRYVLDQVQPTFIHLHRNWDLTLPKDPTFVRDYVSLGSEGDWVRRSAVPNGFDLGALQREGKRLSEVTISARAASAVAGCGTLRIGQTPGRKR